MSGYIQISRKLFSHYLWKENRQYSKFEAWLDLIQLVSYEDNNSILIKGELVKWGRGQYPVSYSFLNKRWGWSTSKTRKYIALLKIDKMATTERAGNATILTICNYDSYNVLATNPKTRNKATPKADPGQQLNTVNKVKKEISIETFLDWFNKSKKHYTGTLGKFKSLSPKDENNFKRIIESYEIEDLETAIPNLFKNQWAVEHNALTPTHFLRVENFNRYLNAEPTKVEPKPITKGLHDE